MKSLSIFPIIVCFIIFITKLAYAHDPNMAYAFFSVIGIVLLLILVFSLFFSFVGYLIVSKVFYKNNLNKSLKKSLFKSSLILSLSLGILGLMADIKFAEDSNFYSKRYLIYFWLVGVFIGSLCGLLLVIKTKNNS